MRKTHFLIFFIAIFSIFFSCNSMENNDQIKHIPNDANIVIAINAKSLYKKMEYDKISFEEIFEGRDQEFFKKNFSKLQEMIDVSRPVYFFSKNKNTVAAGNISLNAAVAKLKSESALKDFISNNGGANTIEKTEKYSYAKTDRGLVGWNKSTVVFANTSDEKQLMNLFAMQPELSLASNKIFTSSLNANDDMNLFINFPAFLSTNPLLSASRLSVLFKDTYTTGSINFNKGEMQGKFETQHSEELHEMLKYGKTKGTSTEIANYFPEESAYYLSFSVNSHFLKSLVEYSGAQSILEQSIGTMGFTLSELLSAINGSVTMVMAPSSPNSLTGMGNYIATIDIADKNVIDKVFAGMVKSGYLVSNNNFYSPKTTTGNASYSNILEVQQDKIIIGSKQDIITKYNIAASSTAQPNKNNIPDMMNDKAFAFYMNDNAMSSQNPDNPFSEIYAYQDKHTGIKTKGLLIMKLKDPNQSSLAATIKFFKSLGNKKPSANARFPQTPANPGIPDEDVIADSAMLSPNP